MKHLAVAYAQVVLSVVFIGGYFAVLGMFVLGLAHPPADYKELISSLLSVLTGTIVIIVSFWFQRQRESKDATTS